VTLTPLRASVAAIATGAAIVVGGLALGSAPTQSTRPAELPTGLDIVPHPGDEPEPVRGSPGSREQVVLFGGLVIALGTLGALGSGSAEAARRAREQRQALQGTSAASGAQPLDAQ
jgi:hypothetical protein